MTELKEGSIPLSDTERETLAALGKVRGYTRGASGRLVVTLADGTEKVV
jgi:hypothetical protein